MYSSSTTTTTTILRLWILSGTTQVSGYHKKNSPTHTHHGHQSSLICFLHLLQYMAYSLFNLRAWHCIFSQSLSKFSLVYLLVWHLHFILHTFFTQSSSTFRSTCPYYWNLFCCDTNLDLLEQETEWQWHQLGHMQICTLTQIHKHASIPPLSFLQVGCPFCSPTNSVKSTEWVSTYGVFLEICQCKNYKKWLTVIEFSQKDCVVFYESHNC